MATISIQKNSRYKDTAVYYEGTSQYAFALWEPVKNFTVKDNSWVIYSVVDSDVGFLDRVAFLNYGDGYEPLWWVIAAANAIIDPEKEMYAGMQLRIPPIETVIQYTGRGRVNS